MTLFFFKLFYNFQGYPIFIHNIIMCYFQGYPIIMHDIMCYFQGYPIIMDPSVSVDIKWFCN